MNISSVTTLTKKKAKKCYIVIEGSASPDNHDLALGALIRGPKTQRKPHYIFSLSFVTDHILVSFLYVLKDDARDA